MAMAEPTVTGINPPGGLPAGGTPVTISGSNFTLGTTSVTFNGTAAGSVNVTGTLTLTAITPAGSLGPANVVVTTLAGSSAAFSGFTYARVPTISDVVETGQPPGTPARGPTTGGTPITITGADFQVGARVFLGGLPAAAGAEATQVVSDQQHADQRRDPLVPLARGTGQAGQVWSCSTRMGKAAAWIRGSITYYYPPRTSTSSFRRMAPQRAVKLSRLMDSTSSPG